MRPTGYWRPEGFWEPLIVYYFRLADETLLITLRESPGGRPLITFFNMNECHVASRTGGGPPCLPCRYGFPAVLAFNRIGLTSHGVTTVLVFSQRVVLPLKGRMAP